MATLITVQTRHAYFHVTSLFIAPDVSIAQSGIFTAGRAVSFICTVTLTGGNSGPPIIEWTGPGDIMSDTDIAVGPVTRDGINQVVYTHELQFTTLRTSHGGEYTCKAVSGDLSQDTGRMLTVQSEGNNHSL